jgi:hypothetical protein
LLHWYAAARQGVLEGGVSTRLKEFRYEVRDGARLFCEELVDKSIPAEHPVRLPYDKEGESNVLSEYIKDQSWFRAEWQFDPTVSGMLIMLDSIHKLFNSMGSLWEALSGEHPPITFHFEALSGLALSADETFIKMNARGKQLTEFEHFKARFIEDLKQNKVSEIDAVAQKFDNQWTYLFWTSFAGTVDESEDKVDKSEDMAGKADRCFVTYLRFLADIFLRWPTGNDDAQHMPSQPQSDKDDLFDCLRVALQKDREQILPRGNIKFLIDTLDKLSSYFGAASANEGLAQFFNRYFSASISDSLPVEGKISLFTTSGVRSAAYGTNLFARCCTAARFPQADKLLFFGCLLVLLVDVESGLASLRLRTLRNILENSQSELRDEFFPEQLLEARELILNGSLSEKTSFNTHQVAEEKTKLRLRLEQPSDAELQKAMDYLEDHILLRGRLAVFSYDDAAGQPVLFKRDTILLGQHFFTWAFGAEAIDYDAVIRGLLSQGDYAYREGPQRLYLGKSGANVGKLSRRDIFTTLDKRSFARLHTSGAKKVGCRHAIQSLSIQTQCCSSAEGFEKKLHAVADSWLEECQKSEKMDWRYYFVKYADMRPQDDESALYFWGYSKQSFNQLKLVGATRQSRNWSPFLRAAIVAAGFSKDCPGDYSPLVFPWCNLALWWSEFSWRVGSPTWNHELDPSQSSHLDEIRGKFPKKIDENGWWHIPGEDSTQDIDYTKPDPQSHRLHDKVDRIALAVPLIKAIYELRKWMAVSLSGEHDLMEN